jgi:hypothetical protein
MEKDTIEPFYQRQAKDFVDSMYNAKVLNNDLTRDNLQGYEDLLAFIFQANANSVTKTQEFLTSVENLKK